VTSRISCHRHSLLQHPPRSRVHDRQQVADFHKAVELALFGVRQFAELVSSRKFPHPRFIFRTESELQNATCQRGRQASTAFRPDSSEDRCFAGSRRCRSLSHETFPTNRFGYAAIITCNPAPSMLPCKPWRLAIPGRAGAAHLPAWHGNVLMFTIPINKSKAP